MTLIGRGDVDVDLVVLDVIHHSLELDESSTIVDLNFFRLESLINKLPFLLFEDRMIFLNTLRQIFVYVERRTKMVSRIPHRVPVPGTEEGYFN